MHKCQVFLMVVEKKYLKHPRKILQKFVTSASGQLECLIVIMIVVEVGVKTECKIYGCRST
jgi:hypothetical protein